MTAPLRGDAPPAAWMLARKPPPPPPRDQPGDRDSDLASFEVYKSGRRRWTCYVRYRGFGTWTYAWSHDRAIRKAERWVKRERDSRARREGTHEEFAR